VNILVTGGSSGLGKSIVEKLSSDKKNHIYFTYNNSIQSSKNICSKYPNATSIKCDFTNKLELDIFLENLKKFNISVLINNFYSWPKNPLMPGTFLTKNFHKMDENIFVDDFKNNIIPNILITQEIIKNFRIKKFGKIITVLSSFLDSPTIGSSLYISNKNYLKGLAKVWAVENVKFNITSNTISPSFMLTPHTLKMDERLIDRFKNNSNELMTVENVSEKISDFLNNQDIPYEHDIQL
jgi:NAD(P)-dependent dehydrogenase (short-subunit alcohol dehydrogenase family)